MPDREQIGPRMDTELWQRFRENVKQRKGQTKGVIGSELENAVRQYLDGNPDNPSEKINARLARIEQELGIAHSDGGTRTVETTEHTHTPETKPAANTATEKKIAWLREQIKQEAGRSFQEIPKKVIRQTVKQEYNFRRDTAKRYVDDLIDEFGLVAHPEADALLVTPERKEELIEAKREEIKEELE